MATLFPSLTQVSFPRAVWYLPWLLLVVAVAWIAYVRLLHPLSGVPGPYLASITKLWYVRKVYEGNFDKLNRELHDIYGEWFRENPLKRPNN